VGGSFDRLVTQRSAGLPRCSNAGQAASGPWRKYRRLIMLPVISQPLVDARAETLSGADSDLNWDGAGRKLTRPTTATAVKAIRLPLLRRAVWHWPGGS
jgi:hypothetical protein